MSNKKNPDSSESSIKNGADESQVDPNAEEVVDEIQNEQEPEEEQSEAEFLRQKIAEMETEIDSMKNKQLRQIAEMDNTRKRLERDRVQTYENARKNAVDAFLPVNDDLLRTLNAMKESNEDSPFIDGLEAVASKFDSVLERYGVERIDETGVPFDVDLHDALMRQNTEDKSIESGTVLKVLENGYKMGDKTIRHAKVIVSE